MLILTRKRGEAVDLVIRGELLATVRVLEIEPSGVVRLGFDARDEVRILRDNAVERKQGDGYGD